MRFLPGSCREPLDSAREHDTGTPRFHHTAAARLVVGGATAKEFAGILGHAGLGSTAIYAKVDLPRLQAVVLPWPGISGRP